MMPSERSETRDLTATSRLATFVFNLHQVSDGDYCDGAALPFCEGLLLHIDPLLLKQYHSCISGGVDVSKRVGLRDRSLA